MISPDDLPGLTGAAVEWEGHYFYIVGMVRVAVGAELRSAPTWHDGVAYRSSMKPGPLLVRLVPDFCVNFRLASAEWSGPGSGAARP